MLKVGNARRQTCLSLRLVENAVHCVQQSHLLIKVQYGLSGKLSMRKTLD